VEKRERKDTSRANAKGKEKEIIWTLK
jgi:hypothetical protein